MSEGRPDREAGHWGWRGGTFEDVQGVRRGSKDSRVQRSILSGKGHVYCLVIVHIRKSVRRESVGTLLSGAQFRVLSTVDVWGQLILRCGRPCCAS